MTDIIPVYNRRRAAKGSFDTAGRATVICRLDVDTFQQVRLMAAHSQVSFSEQVRRLVQVGLLARGQVHKPAA